jgi:hypothetical protein
MPDRANTTTWPPNTEISVRTAHPFTVLSHSRQMNVELKPIPITHRDLPDLTPHVWRESYLAPRAKLDMRSHRRHRRRLLWAWA